MKRENDPFEFEVVTPSEEREVDYDVENDLDTPLIQYVHPPSQNFGVGRALMIHSFRPDLRAQEDGKFWVYCG